MATIRDTHISMHLHTHACVWYHTCAFTPAHTHTHTQYISAHCDQYKYLQQLLELDKCRPVEATSKMLPDKLKHIKSPIRLRVWRQSLALYPDQQFAQYILKGLEEGFRIDFHYQQAYLKQHKANMVIRNPSIVYEYLDTETHLNKVVKLPERQMTWAFTAAPLE